MKRSRVIIWLGIGILTIIWMSYVAEFGPVLEISNGMENCR